MSDAATSCPFCNYAGPSPILDEGMIVTRFDGIEFFVIEPLNPVTRGHRLVIPREHIADFREYPEMLGALMQVAASVMRRSIAATQTVPHVHVHVVPRREGDGLPLPWSAS